MTDELEAGTDTLETLLAEEEGEFNEGDELGAEPEDLPAEEGGEAAEETTNEKPEEVTEEHKKQPHQKTLEERLPELVDKKVAERLAEIERQTQERIASEKLPYVELTEGQAKKLNDDYAAAFESKFNLEEMYRLTEDSAEKARILTDLRKAERWITETEQWYAANEQKKSEYLAQKGSQETQAREVKERAVRLETTANVYREANKIPVDVWDSASQWFAEQLKGDQLLQLKFQDAYRTGDVAAVDFAYRYCNENMSKKAEESIQDKQDAKTKLTPGVSSVLQKVSADPKLKALFNKAKQSGSEEDYLEYVAAKRKAGV